MNSDIEYLIPAVVGQGFPVCEPNGTWAGAGMDSSFGEERVVLEDIIALINQKVLALR